MVMRATRFPPEPDSVQVWRQLDAHLRQQAVSLVAQMAFNFVKTQSESSQQESKDDDPTQRAETPQ